MDSLENARKHYLMSLKLKPSNLRSLYGLYQTAITFNRFAKVKKDAKVKNEDIVQWCTSQLLEAYQVHNATNVHIVCSCYVVTFNYT